MSDRRFQRKILVLFLAGLSLRLLWIYLVPLWQQADEYPHFHYIQYIHQHKTLPVSDPKFPYYEGYQPPLYYLLGAGVYALFPALDSHPDAITEESDLDWRSPDFPKHNAMALILRWLSVIFWTGTFQAAYLFLKGVFPGQEQITLNVLGLLSFIPTLASNNSSITNDGLAILLATVFILLMVTLNLDKPCNRHLLGLVLGWSMLTKYNCFLLIALFALYTWKFHRKNFIRNSSWVMSVALAILTPWLLRNYQVYGGLFPLNPGVETVTSHSSGNLGDLIWAVRNLGWSFWAAAGRVYEIHLPIWFYVVVFGGISLAAGWGLVKYFVMPKPEADSLHPQPRLLMVLSGGTFLLILASLWSTLYCGLLTSWGKNLFIFALPITLLLSVGWHRLSSNRVWNYSLPAVLGLTHILYLFGFAVPHFHGQH